MCESLGRGIEQLVRTVLRPYRGVAAAVLLSLLTALAPGRSLAAPAPLMRIIHVAQIAVSLFYNAPTHQMLVIGAAPYVNSSSNGNPLTYTVLDGKTGAAIKRLAPTIAPLGFTTVQPSADGSGQLYLGTASGLQPLEAHGRLGAPVVPPATLYTPLSFSLPGWKPDLSTLGPFSGPVAVDHTGSLALLWGGAWGGSQGVAGLDARSMQVRYTWISDTGIAPLQPPAGCCGIVPAPYSFVLDPAQGRMYTAAGTALTALDVATGHVLGSLHAGWTWGVEAVPGTHLLLTLGAPVSTESETRIDPHTGQFGAVHGPSHNILRVTIVNTQPFRLLHILNIPAPSMLWSGPNACLGPCMPQPLAVDPAAGHALLLSGTSSVLLLSVQTGTLLRTIDVEGSVYGVAVDPGLHRAYVISSDWSTYTAQLTVLNTLTGAKVATVTRVSMPTGVAVDTEDHTVFIAQASTGTVLMVQAGITGNHEAPPS